MRVICPISGLPHNSSELFKGERPVSYPHPIFSLDSRSLLARARKYSQGNYSSEELRLLFLAILNRTEAVKWEVPATPSHDCVLRNLDQAYHMMLWLEKVDVSFLKIPTYRVTIYNQDLSNISTFFDSVYEARETWSDGSRRRLLEQLVESKEMLLYKAIHSQGKKTPSFWKRLAHWAMDVARIDAIKNPEKREEWIELFQMTEPDQVFSADREELMDMCHCLHENLTVPGGVGLGSGLIYTQEVLKHINWFEYLLRVGPKGFIMDQIGGPSHSFAIKQEATSSILDLETEISQLEQQIIDEAIPLKEPARTDFLPTEGIAFLKAKVRWTATHTVRDKLLLARKSLEARKLSAEKQTKEVEATVDKIDKLKTLLSRNLNPAERSSDE